MRRRRNKVRPAKVRYADEFRRFLESFAGAYRRSSTLAPVQRGTTSRTTAMEMSRYMIVKPIVIPASAFKQPTKWTAREVEVMLRQAMLRSYYPTENTE